MKKLLLLFWLLPVAAFAQSDSIKTKPHYVYCRIYLTGGVMFSKNYYKADFGKKTGSAYSLDAEFKKLNEQLASFDNEIDALNFMDMQGWEFVDYTSVRDAPNTDLLRKRIPE